jgi:putative ABC transport system permease protein
MTSTLIHPEPTMRFTDLLWLSLSALWQQKLRGILTTLGVVFGAFVLVFSLSLGEGVQTTIARESHRTEFLRKIIVHPGWQPIDDKSPGEATEVQGEMSDETRARLRTALADMKMRYTNPPRVLLTEDRLRALGNLDHVVSVTPLAQQGAFALYGSRAVEVATIGVDPDSPALRQRLVAGAFFERPDEHSLIISELTCYQLGITNEADMRRLLGTRLRLKFQSESYSPVGLNVYLYKGDGNPPTLDERTAVEKIRQQLPGALEHLNLSDSERAALRKALNKPQRVPKSFQEEFTVVGIMRLPTTEELQASWESSARNASVLLPRQTAEDLVFRHQERAAMGVDEATILVDQEANVRDVLQHVNEMHFQAHAPIEYIERERFIYLLIFTTMACVAAVALLVAALGIANTMLMSVLERTREIGIFKAVGAGDGTVQLVFLIEGAFIGLIGGGLGVLLGWAASFPADAWVRSMISRDLKIELKESLFVFPWWLTVSVVVFAVVVTTLAAVFPARRAARVNPVTALRNE